MFWLDTLFVALAILAAALGAWTGFLWQAARLVGLTAALTATVLLHDSAVRWIQVQLLPGVSDLAAHVLAYAGIFLLVYVTLYILTRLLYRGIQETELQTLDRWCGALLGAGKMLLLLAGVSLALHYSSHAVAQDLWRQSTLAPICASCLERIIAVVPEDYQDTLKQTLQEAGDWVQARPNEDKDRLKSPPPSSAPDSAKLLKR